MTSQSKNDDDVSPASTATEIAKHLAIAIAYFSIAALVSAALQVLGGIGAMHAHIFAFCWPLVLLFALSWWLGTMVLSGLLGLEALFTWIIKAVIGS